MTPSEARLIEGSSETTEWQNASSCKLGRCTPQRVKQAPQTQPKAAAVARLRPSEMNKLYPVEHVCCDWFDTSHLGV